MCTTSMLTDGDAETASRRRAAGPGARRLVHHARLAAQARRERAQRLFLQDDQAIREFERKARLARSRQIPVQIRSGEHDAKRPIGECAPVAQERVVAAPGVQRDEEVAGAAVPGLLHRHPMPRAAQECGPAQRRVPVAVARPRAGGRDDRDARHGLRLD